MVHMAKLLSERWTTDVTPRYHVTRINFRLETEEHDLIEIYWSTRCLQTIESSGLHGLDHLPG